MWLRKSTLIIELLALTVDNSGNEFNIISILILLLAEFSFSPLFKWYSPWISQSLLSDMKLFDS